MTCRGDPQPLTARRPMISISAGCVPCALAGGAHRPATIDRKVLLDLRDALRAFLTLLETE